MMDLSDDALAQLANRLDDKKVARRQHIYQVLKRVRDESGGPLPAPAKEAVGGDGLAEQEAAQLQAIAGFVRGYALVVPKGGIESDHTRGWNSAIETVAMQILDMEDNENLLAAIQRQQSSPIVANSTSDPRNGTKQSESITGQQSSEGLTADEQKRMNRLFKHYQGRHAGGRISSPGVATQRRRWSRS